ncbi:MULTISPECIES: hypothetical protein [Pseudomonas]|uniref:hypothetical protein n=1 Tax=Pseudomonas TaxID=286 RepID=UPI00123B3F8E|nr:MULTISPECIES: hypothetical protein [Pseudomonas]QIB51758.1 hypothetical protein G3M63_12285 [Pseudomonas sp. OIL-1]
MHTLKTLLTASLLVSFSLAGPAVLANEKNGDHKTGQNATSSQSGSQQNDTSNNRSAEPGETGDTTHTSPYKKTYPAEDPVTSGEANETDNRDNPDQR